MSMLAEPRRKQKWTLNPRGKDWSNDTNKFGQKMLERMGWTNGRGLGAKEDGITEHIKISYKNDSKGMGFKDRNDQWTEHEDKFSSLLENLSQTETSLETSITKTKSLEEKSQKSRARVHYHKFTRGKDLTRYSEKDLANIFGRRELKKCNKIENIESASNSDLESKQPENEPEHLIQVGSMVDYFKKKLPNFSMQKDYQVGKNGVLEKVEVKSEDLDYDDERPSFGFGFKVEDETSPKPEEKEILNSFGFKDENEIIENKTENESISQKKKKKKKQKKDEGNFISYVSNDSQNQDEVDEIPSKKKKKKKYHTENELEQNDSGFINECFNPNQILEERENVVKEDICPYEVKREPKKQKRKLEESGIENNAFEDLNVTPEEIERQENPYEIKPKKKRKTELNSEIEVKSKKKAKTKSYEEEMNDQKQNPFEVKPKKSKKNLKSEEVGIENSCFEVVDESPTTVIQENPYEIKPKKKKKMKQLEKEIKSEEGLDNPALNLDDTPIEDDLMLNVTIETIEKETPKTTPVPVTPRTPKRKSVRFSDVNVEHIIPNNYQNKLAEAGFINNGFNLTDKDQSSYDTTLEAKKKKRKKNGVSNIGFNTSTDILQEIETVEAEVENNLNEAKIEQVLIGESGVTDRNVKIKDGVRLSFSHANFKKTAVNYYAKEKEGTPKSAYKHLIKGDVIIGFKNTNLHEINGYAIKKVRETVV